MLAYECICIYMVAMLSDFAIVAASCHLHAARAKARRLTAIYEGLFTPLDLTASQFSTLVALAVSDHPAVQELAERLDMDRSTLSRGLQPLVRRGLIDLEPDPDDARCRRAGLTEAGRAILERAIPLWRQAQQLAKD